MKTEVFYQSLTQILQKEAILKNAKVTELEENYTIIQWMIRDIVERIHKLDLFSDDFSISNFLENSINAPIGRILMQQQKPWLNDKLTIGLVGHFNSGKTSFLNTLFGENFPVAWKETTALPCYLTHGNNTNTHKLVYKDNSVIEIDDQQAQLLNFVTTNNFPFAKVFDYLVKENDNNLLQNVSFIDTPGLASTIDGHTDPTFQIIQYCDIILWFIPITDGDLDTDSIRFIKNNIQEKPIFFVFTFADDPAWDYEQVKQQVLNTANKNDIKVIGYLKYEHPHKWMIEKKDSMPEEHYILMKEEYDARINNIKNDFQQLYDQSISQHKRSSPISLLIESLNLLLDFVILGNQRIRELIDETTKDQETTLNEYKKNMRTFTTSIQGLGDRCTQIIDTFNQRCSNVLFCTSTSTVIANQINHITENLNEMIDAFNNIDGSQLVIYGRYESSIEKFNEISKSLDEIKTDLTNVSNNLKKLLGL